MKETKNALTRYKVLDYCFRNKSKRYTIDDLLNAVNKELSDKGVSISKRQLWKDIGYMQDPLGYNIALKEHLRDGKKRIFMYEDTDFTIFNLPLNIHINSEVEAMIDLLRQFSGLPQFASLNELVLKINTEVNPLENTISFDTNPDLVGLDFLDDLFNFIQNNKVLNIEYQSFKANNAKIITIHPYHLKQYNKRWFLFGLEDEKNRISNLALDRIKGIKPQRKKYIKNTTIVWEEYFDDIIGVTKYKSSTLEEIVLHIKGESIPYIKSKPLHHSQKTKMIDDNTLEVRLKLMVNPELEFLLLSYGSAVKVISPGSLKDKIKNHILDASKFYH
jgi:predicted DNA-binding transcriptional regulator YafY